MRTLFFILLSLFINVGNTQNVGKLLEKAYKKESPEMLHQFFLNWNKEIQPISEKELLTLNDTIRNTYNVFTAFYKPQSIDSLGGSEWGNSIYDNVEFLVVQNSIKIYFDEKLFWSEQETDKYIVDFIKSNVIDTALQNLLLKRTEGKLSENVIDRYGPKRKIYFERNVPPVDSIVNFRPIINCNGKRPVYLTTKYSDILINFLGNKHEHLGNGGIMTPALATKSSANRKTFLENQIKIWYGHWGGYWQLHSYPTAYAITFDHEMQYAIIDFRMIYEGGEALLKNVNGSWVLVSSELTWIE
ncbi:MAG: hypothetical protein IPI65_02110 [Bacteroidetes bacterium]|nr:hypothetical protein [Bacteroidota bacterium]